MISSYPECGTWIHRILWPLPTSGCLEVSENPDGCALFVKHSKFHVISCEAKSLALSIAKLKEGELEEDETSISQQNQMAIIAVIEFINYKGKKAKAPKYTM